LKFCAGEVRVKEERRGEERRGQERNIQHAIKRRKAADWLHFVYAVPSERPY